MGALTGKDDLILRATGGGSGAPEFINWFRDDRLAGVLLTGQLAGKPYSLWQIDGVPSHGLAAPPTTPRNPTNATSGALKQTDPAGGRSKFLTFASAVANQLGLLMFYDRLQDISGFSGTNAGAQTVGGSLTRYTNGKGNEIWIEIYTQIGATSTTIKSNYTDSNNAAKVTPLAGIGNTGFREQLRIIRLPFAIGGPGVKSVTSVTLSATTGTVGNFGVTIAHPLAYCSPSVIGLAGMINMFDLIIEIQPAACISMIWYPVGNAAVSMLGQMFFIDV